MIDRFDVSEGVQVNKIRESKVCDTCCNWYFLNKWIKFQANVCNRCHDLLMMSMNLSDIAILNIKSADYCCIVCESKVINVMQKYLYIGVPVTFLTPNSQNKIKKQKNSTLEKFLTFFPRSFFVIFWEIELIYEMKLKLIFFLKIISFTCLKKALPKSCDNC